ncbi:MAG: 2-dehydropantoate 2-reductase [Verrucomicrobia bacterium]|nr:2-dehydropantoate 2-reductase [Verrucomicrobiota bacterium]MBU4248204.1 2-dehydropantoate 2-reductase [Verrucomicrobiota bacterium]MBU4429974.1 2-dehydropantoate 2-reductase [Verrucomicrobiota bacterium]MBU4497396.1 2-dehydropantoate 2-reductase [Verrucomicrobiota bacterium]MCG2679902.1 2-dehydropantoate 2-reductase [Kiritimatiellia bacterium]
MKIVIIGPGAMGCLFAGLLTEAGHEVHLLDKYPERAEHIARQGLRIEAGGKTRVIRVNATASPATLKDTDLIGICVKAYDTGSTIPSLLALVSERTLVLTLQNGLGNVEQVAAHIHPAHVFAGVTAHGSTLLGRGHVRHAGNGPTTIGSLLPEHHGRAMELAVVLSRASPATTAAPDMKAVLWSKLIINACIGPLSALSGLANGQLAEQVEWRTLLRSAAEEAAAVAARKSIRLLYVDPVQAVLEVCRSTADNISSMLQDIRRGRKTEIDAINGAIIREAGALGIPVPVHEELIRRIRALG